MATTGGERLLPPSQARHRSQCDDDGDGVSERDATPAHLLSPNRCTPASLCRSYPKNGVFYREGVTSADDAPPRPTRLVLIRHGESRSTVDRVVGGHRGCSGLTDRAVRQAKALRDRLAHTRELAGGAARPATPP